MSQSDYTTTCPHYECYEVCREAWTNYINDSLRGLIVAGKGQPNSKEEDGFNAQLVEKWKLGERFSKVI